MFWKFDLHPNSSLDTILSKEDCTLSEILDEDDVLQECKSQNRKLLDFLVRPETLEELVDLITKEPADDVDEKLKYKYPNTACELLTSDVQIIVEQMTASDVLLSKLWTFLETEKTLNPLLASFFSKVISLLISRKTSVVLDFLKTKEKPVDCILRHIDTSAIMDLVLRLATNVEASDLRFELLQWLNEEKLIQKLIDLVDPQNSADKIGNASQALCDLIKTSREHMSQLQENAFPDPLLATIENKETLSALLDHMLHEVHLNSSSDALVGGVSVLLTLLEVNKSNSESPFANVELGEPVTILDAERLAHGVTTTLSALLPRLDGFHQILTDPPPMSVMITTAGKLDPPFGKTRLQVMKLFTAILQTNSEEANMELAKLGSLQVMWELFFQYPWNNFLHSEVEHSINTILCNAPVEKESEGEHSLLTTLMKYINIIHKITEIFSFQEKGKDDGCLKRHGFMGHLTKIANDLCQNMEKGKNQEKITALYNELEQSDKDSWEQFVSGKLAEINKRNSTDLAGRHPLQSSDDEDEDFRPGSFLRNGNANSYQQAFTHYQMQQMAPEFLDNIGFDEEQFPESDDHMIAPFDRITGVNFTIDANDDNPNSAMFEAACNERIHAFDDNDSDEEDVWHTKEISFSSAVELRSSVSDDSESSESEEEEVEGRDEKSSLNKSKDEGFIADTKEFASVRTSSPSPKENQSEDSTMDVDHNDVWATNVETEPVSMDVQAADPASVGWTSEPNKIESDQGNCGWAKFDDLTSISETSSQTPTVEFRSGSPVAMDTEASSPNPAAAGSAYVVDSEEAEMSDGLSKSEATSEADICSDVFLDSKDEKQPDDSGNKAESDRMNLQTSESRQNRVVPLAPREEDEDDDEDDDLNQDAESRLLSDEGKESSEENTTTTTSLKTNGATETSDAKTTELISTSDTSTETPACERTSQGDAACAITSGSSGDVEETQTGIVDSGVSQSPEKIPVSARNGPSLS